jgi:hypothetical protein
VDTQQWWDSLSPEAQDALARDPHGPVPAGVVDEVTATGRAWSASWESDYVRRDEHQHFLSPELAPVRRREQRLAAPAPQGGLRRVPRGGRPWTHRKGHP